VAGAPPVIEGVAVVDAGAGRRFTCAACGCDLGDAAASYRTGCAELDVALEDLSDLFASPVEETGQAFVLRQALCPGCGRLLDAHVCRPTDEPFPDVRVAVATATEPAATGRPTTLPASPGAPR
jgi:hypothetical protein